MHHIRMELPLLAAHPPTPPWPLQVIPQLSGDATSQTPPDLPSYLFKERIVYLVSGLPIPLVVEGPGACIVHQTDQPQSTPFALAPCRECPSCRK